jgi:hypothetical protein
VFLSQEVTLPLSFAVARARLLRLTRSGALSTASGEAFAVGRGDAPPGETPGGTSLVRVQFAEPAPRGDLMVLPLRWEAMGPTGRLFPVLDADITLLPVGGLPASRAHAVGSPGGQTRLVVAGSYRPASDGLGIMVDVGWVQQVAAATICCLLHKIAGSLCTATSSEVQAPAEPPAEPLPQTPIPLLRGTLLRHTRRSRKRPA